MKRRDMLGLSLALCPPGPAAWARPGSAGEPAPANAQGLRVPDVRLLDHRGQPQPLAELCRQPVLLAFFYTGCASVCPPQTAALRALRERLDAAAVGGVGAAGAERRPAMLLSISLDPLNDTPEALARYAARFGVRLGRDAGWLMLTGERAQLKPVWRTFDAPENAAAEHSALVWVGDAGRGRWTRASALSPTAALLALLQRQAT